MIASLLRSASVVLLLAIAVLFPSVSAQCSTQSSGLYNISICPLPSPTPPPLLNGSVIAKFYSNPTAATLRVNIDDGVSPRISMPWGFHLFGSVWDQFYVSTNGLISFGPTPYSDANDPLPVFESETDMAPLIAPFWTDLYLNQSLGNIFVSFEGTAPSRYAIIRFDHVAYKATHTLVYAWYASLTCDVILYEGTQGLYDVMYYNIDDNIGVATVYTAIYTIGTQSNDAGTSYSLLTLNNTAISAYTISGNYFPYNPTGFQILKALSGNYTRYTFTGLDVSQYTCSGAGFDFSAYAGLPDLVYTNTTNSSIVYYYHPCGVVSASACTSTVTAESAMACLVRSSAISLIANYEPQQALYRPLPGGAQGLQIAYQNGVECSGFETISYFNYFCDSSATTPQLDNVTVGICSYTFNLRSIVACSQGNFPTTTTSATTTFPTTASTLTSCVSNSGSNYSISLCPRTITSNGYYAINQTNPQQVYNATLINSGSGTTGHLPLPFPFYFFEEVFTSLQISQYTMIGFGATFSTSQPGTFPSSGNPLITYSSSLDDWPVIIPMQIQMATSAFCTSTVTVSTEGTAPNRQYVIRYSVCSNYESGLLQPTLTLFDVVLSEGEPAGIEFRYYQLPPIASQYFAVGIHGSVDITQYTTLTHYGYTQMTPPTVRQFTGSNVVFQYIGRTAQAGCTAFGVNFSPVSQMDLVYVNSTANYTIYARPCGDVNASVCSQNPNTAFASICQVGAAGPILLSQYTPTAVVFSSSPAGPGVRQILSDGSYCSISGGSYASRITRTDYLCSKGNSTTALVNVVENPTCTFTLTIQTPLACSSTAACTTRVGDQYSWLLCPVVATALTQTTPSFVFSGAAGTSDNVIAPATLPFPFYVYGVPYSSVSLSSKGNLQFGVSGNGSATIVLPVAAANVNQLPLFAPFLADLIITGNGSVTSSLETISAGQRAFVLRFLNVNYVQDVATNRGVSFDVLMYETPLGRIDVRYYRVDADSSVNAYIGLQSSNVTRYLLYAGQNVSTSLAATLQGSTLSFTFTGNVTNSTTTSTAASANLCLLSYGLPGNVDYPWSSAISLQLTYSASPVTTSLGSAYSVLSASGQRTFTNRFGASISTAVTLVSSSTAPLLYVSSSVPFDSNGLLLNLASPVQIPGVGPNLLFSQVNVRNVSGVLVEGNSTRVDAGGQAFLSNIPGFVNLTIGASNINSLAPIYATCSAPISFVNGLRAPIQPSSSNGAMRISYSYFVSDGTSYSVQGNLTITTTSAFATTRDALGNPYQTVVNVTGSRLYTYLPTGASIKSTVNGLSTAANANADQRFYPYSLLVSSPGIYTTATSPFFDNDGLEMNVSPSITINGAPPGQAPLFTATTLYMSTPEPTAVLTEGYYTNLPSATLQQQSYALLL